MASPSLRVKVRRVLFDPEKNRVGRWLSYYFDLLIILSMIGLCMQTVQEWRRKLSTADFCLETFISVQFVTRLGLKLWSCEYIGEFLSSQDFLFDLLGILPWIVEAGLFFTKHNQKARWWAGHFRVLRMFRFGRLLSCGWVLPAGELKMFGKALRRSRAAFQLLAGYGLTGMLCFAWALWIAESWECSPSSSGILTRLNGKVCPMQNVFESLWLCLCTLATVGYGDFVPRSVGGKLIVSAMMGCGYVFLALPVAIFGANLTELYVEARMKKRLRHQQHAFEDDTEAENNTVQDTVKTVNNC